MSELQRHGVVVVSKHGGVADFEVFQGEDSAERAAEYAAERNAYEPVYGPKSPLVAFVVELFDNPNQNQL